MIKPVMTWAEIDKNWAHIMEVMRSKLPLDEEIALNRSGERIPAQRPMLEDIVCCRSARDDLLLEYMGAAGMKVKLGADRMPREIDTAARNKIGFGQGGQGRKV